MRYTFFILVLFIGMQGNAQSLKELLFSGRLKMDSGKVVRKTDDLSTKIDTTTRKPVEPEKPVQALDTAVAVMTTATDSSGNPVMVVDTLQTAIKENTNSTKDNNTVWKTYMDELVTTLQTDVVPNKKLKSGTYSVLLDYEIGLEGQVTVTNVSVSPESSYLADQVKDRVTLTAPQLSPLLNSYGKPRKAAKKYTFTINK